MTESTISLAFQEDWVQAMFNEERNYNLDRDVPFVFIRPLRRDS